MEGSGDTLVLSSGLTVIVIVGLAVLFTAPFTDITPVYLIHFDHWDSFDLVLDDNSPMMELDQPFMSKFIIDGMNATAPIDIYLYEFWLYTDPQLSLSFFHEKILLCSRLIR